MIQAFIVALIAVLLSGVIALADNASLSAPAEAVIGSQIKVTWTGPGDQYDPIYLVEKNGGEDAKSLSSTSIISKRNPVLLNMPETPGEYDIVYKPKSVGSIAARRTITVVDVPTSIDAPETASIGEKVTVSWKGPGNSYESLSLYENDAADDAKALVGGTVLQGRSSLSMKLPEVPGTYELRYMTRKTRRILARRKITVEGVDSSIEAPEQAELGATITVKWTGPGNSYDRIALYPEGAADNAKSVTGASILNSSPVSIRLPEDPGKYELRYVLNKSRQVLARRAITVGAVESALEAPERATAATSIDVAWKGPGNRYDQIAVFKAGSADTAKPLVSRAILNEQNPLPILLPDVQGEYELRYRTAQKGTVLARRPITIEPAGKLAVVFETEGTITSNAAASGGEGAVELILDASGSMLQKLGGSRRIEIARDVLTKLVKEDLPDEQKFALRVFGHKQANACRSDLEIPLSTLERNSVAKQIAAVNAKNLAKTPIADSLAKVPSDLSGAKGPKMVILITDGEETCDGDPEQVIRNLRAQGLDIQVSIVGFAIDEPALKEQFETWAKLGGGTYFDANSAEELSKSLRTVISGPFKVFDSKNEVAGKGIIGGAPIVLPAGEYRVETVGGLSRVLEGVVIKPEETTRVNF